MDLYSRYIIHWRISNTQHSSQFCEAVSDALALHPAPAIFHSDKGSQYTCRKFQSILRSHRIATSMTGTGGYKDNIDMERLIGTFQDPADPDTRLG